MTCPTAAPERVRCSVVAGLAAVVAAATVVAGLAVVVALVLRGVAVPVVALVVAVLVVGCVVVTAAVMGPVSCVVVTIAVAVVGPVAGGVVEPEVSESGVPAARRGAVRLRGLDLHRLGLHEGDDDGAVLGLGQLGGSRG